MVGFFHIGRGFPFYYGVRGLRHILFGSYPTRITEAALIIFGWLLGSLILFICISFITIRKKAWRLLNEESVSASDFNKKGKQQE